MKQITTILFVFLVIGCATDKSGEKAAADESIESIESIESLAPQVITNPNDVVIPTDQPFTPNPNQTTAPADADGIVWHFVCPDNCEGGVGDKKAPCPVCGKELAHNQAFHGNNQQANPANPAIPATPGDPTAAPTFNPTQPQATPEPPQNAQGVWHYKCADGCVGGGGGPGPCAVCGKPLAHNAGYHQ